MFSEKAIQMKAKMLCQGVNVDQELQEKLDQQNPSKVKRGGLSSGGKFFIIDNEDKLPVNAPIYYKRESLVKILFINERLVVSDGHDYFPINPIDSPKWYEQDVNGYPIASIVTAHNLQLATAIYEDCALFHRGKPCEFCVMNYSQENLNLVLKSGELINQVLKKIPVDQYGGLTLNGGMTFHSGRGMEIIEPVVREIHQQFPELPIAVEITPPEDLDWINKIAEAGISSLMMNLECWDETIRQKTIPGKNQLCSRESYLLAFKRGLDCLGEGKISTCFVVGTESIKSLQEGIKEVVLQGVIPSPLAGRYFEDIPDYPFVPDVDWRKFLEIVYFTASELQKQKITSTDKAGCVACGMCDLIKNLM